MLFIALIAVALTVGAVFLAQRLVINNAAKTAVVLCIVAAFFVLIGIGALLNNDIGGIAWIMFSFPILLSLSISTLVTWCTRKGDVALKEKEFTIENETLEISGTDRNYTFLQISDAHIVYARPDDSDEDKALAAKHTDKWNTNNIAPVDAFSAVLQYADYMRADALFIAGDCVDYIKPAIAEHLKEMLKTVETKIHYVYGNHEGGVYVGETPPQSECYPYYAELMEGNPSFWTQEYEGFTVVGIDNSDRRITPEQLSFMKEQCARGRSLILTMHIPLFTDDICEPVKKHWGEEGIHHFTLGTQRHDETTRAFCELVKSPESNVCAILAGHTHFAYKGEFAPGRMQYVSAPAFTRYIRKITVVPKK